MGGGMVRFFAVALLSAALLSTACKHYPDTPLQTAAVAVFCSRPWESADAMREAQTALEQYERAIDDAARSDPAMHNLTAHRDALAIFRDVFTMVGKRRTISIAGHDEDVFAADAENIEIAKRYSGATPISPREGEGGQYFAQTAPGLIWPHAGAKLEPDVGPERLKACF
jgi:hypothetical protein